MPRRRKRTNKTVAAIIARASAEPDLEPRVRQVSSIASRAATVRRTGLPPHHIRRLHVHERSGGWISFSAPGESFTTKELYAMADGALAWADAHPELWADWFAKVAHSATCGCMLCQYGSAP